MIWEQQTFLIIGFGAILLAGLAALSIIDLKTFRLPNPLTYGLICLGLVQAYILQDSLKPYLIGAAAGYFVFVAIEYGFRILRGIDGLGRGDAKLLAAGGAWCGWSFLPYIVLIGSLLGILAALLPIFRTHEKGWVPFGPFLSFGIFTVWTAQWLI